MLSKQFLYVFKFFGVSGGIRTHETTVLQTEGLDHLPTLTFLFSKDYPSSHTHFTVSSITENRSYRLRLFMRDATMVAGAGIEPA